MDRMTSEKSETVPDKASTVDKFRFPENLHDTKSTWVDMDMLEILKVTKILENASVPCCIMGTSALKYYFAGRIRFVSFPSS